MQAGNGEGPPKKEQGTVYYRGSPAGCGFWCQCVWESPGVEREVVLPGCCVLILIVLVLPYGTAFVPVYVMAHLCSRVSQAERNLHIFQTVACTVHASSHMLIIVGPCSLLISLKIFSKIRKM